ncbi:phage tail tape measure protein [Pseudomonas tolaasii]|uniref:phage tail tape measure protein n=1 Tax=Pseudomonas tolaasii TaxID=29442 RepID=UPI001C5807A5|nr:phage tail tape measure protein [Pseudomonas tolaasii]MBW1249784.1 phage tail tape measure protein [Pseudomonas tolaasii]
MTSISELGIKVDSTDAVQASTDLDKLTAAGDRAEKSTNALGETSDQAKARILELAKAAVAARESQQNLSSVATGLSEAQQGLITSTNGSAQAQAQAAAAQRATVVTTDRLAVSSAKANAVTVTQQNELQQLLEQIDPTTKALNRLDEQERKLAQQKKLGLEPEVFSAYQGKIQQTRESLTRFDDSLTRTGNTAKQTAAALRGVPAQFTDIFVSLQGGQAPLTVLLQQGGQLKDMFGGIAPAARALGGYVLGLINPFTLAAAAVAALGLAYYKGSEEADSYNKALIFTGNAAGTSASQLAVMAQQVSSTIGTTGAAAEVLAKLAGNGKIASGSFEQITEAALQMERATGRSIDETVAEFSKIAKDPVAAAKELNDQYHFLTAAVYAQIVALKEQGDTVGAANLLTDTYASTIATRAGQITQNLGLIERGWNSIRDAAKAALDVPLSIGREKGLADQLADERAKLADLEKKSGGNSIVASSAAVTKEREQLQESIRLKEIYIEIEKRQNKYVGDRQKIQDEGIAATERADARHLATMSNAEKRALEIKKINEDTAKIRAANPDDKRVDPKYVAQQIKDVNEKFKDPKTATGSVDLTSFNDSKNQLNAVLSYYKSAEKELEAAQKAGIISQESYTSQRIALLQQQASEVKSSYEAEISALEAAKGKAGTSAAQRIQLDQKIADARANMVKAQQESDSELAVIATNEQGRLKKQELAIKSYTYALDQQNAALQRAGSRAAQGVGQSDRQNAINGDLNGISDRANQQRLDLARDKADASRNMSAEEYQAKLEAINRSERDLTQTTLSNYEQMSAAQSDWRNGATSAFSNYLDSARDIAGQTRSLFTNAFSSMEDAVANFAITGKLSFSDFAKSIIADMARIATRQAASGLLSSLAGSALGAYFGGGGAAAGAGSFGSSIGSAITANAKGGVYDSPSLSSFSNQVHDKPQMFAFAKGAGIFAEAGPEAIMPLTRTAGGELGVRALSGGGAGGDGGNTDSKTEITININRNGEADATADTALGQKLAPRFLTLIRAEIAANERRTLSPSGGATWRVINGR